MRRRDFLLAIPVALSSTAAGQSAVQKRRQARPGVRRARPAPSPLDRVCVSSLSFDSFFEATPGGAVTSAAERLVLLDFPQMVADRYKVHNLEFAASQFASPDPEYQQALRTNLLAARSRLVNIQVDIKELEAGGGLSAPVDSARNAALDAATPWIDVARRLGARSVCCEPGDLDPDNLSPTIDSYRKLATYGRRRNIAVLIENRGAAICAHPEALVQICREIGGPFLGTLPDFGGFADNDERLRGLRLLFGYARSICHARQATLDPVNGQPTFDLQQCVQIAKDAAFRGVYGVDCTGGPDAYASVQNTADELARCL